MERREKTPARLLAKGVGAALVAAALAVASLLGVFAELTDLTEGEVNPWKVVNLSRYPFMCSLYELGKNHTPTGKFLPSCIIISPQFFLTHYTGLDIQDYTLYLNGTGRYDVVAGMEPNEGANYRKLARKKEVQFQTIDNTIAEQYDGKGPFSLLIMGRSKKPFRENRGFVEFWPLLDISLFPKGHDEMCMGLAWLKNPDGTKYKLRRTSFYVRRADECNMENFTQFPACVSGRDASRMCLAEPTSVVVVCQGAILGFYSRFDQSPENKDKCTNKRSKEPDQLKPQRIRVLSKFRYELYFWVRHGRSFSPQLPTSEPLKLPWVPPSERPGGEGSWKSRALALRPPNVVGLFFSYAAATGLLST